MVRSYYSQPNYLISHFICVFNIFKPRSEEDGPWRKLHNEELHSLYSLQNIFFFNWLLQSLSDLGLP
jgi:hypothetical protein